MGLEHKAKAMCRPTLSLTGGIRLLDERLTTRIDSDLPSVVIDMVAEVVFLQAEGVTGNNR